MSNILYVVENARGMNSVVSMQRIVNALTVAGHRIYLSSASPMNETYLPTVEKFFNPVTQPISYSGQVRTMDAQWITQGLADPSTIGQLCTFYGTLVSKYGINMIVADSAPMAQLFAYAKRFPIVTVQSAYSMPPVLPYQRRLVVGGSVNLMDSQALKAGINAYLQDKGATLINDMSDLYTQWGTHITTSYKVMDPFSLASGMVRTLNYVPPITGALTNPPPVWRKDNVPNVVVYADHNKRIIPGLITQLLLVDDAHVVLVSSDGYILSQLPSDLRSKVTWKRSPLASLSDYITTADLVVCNANEVTTSEAVNAAVPVLAIPVQQNQKNIANWLVSNGLGVDISSSLEITSALTALMDGLGTYKTTSAAYAMAHMTEDGNAIAQLLGAISNP